MRERERKMVWDREQSVENASVEHGSSKFLKIPENRL